MIASNPRLLDTIRRWVRSAPERSLPPATLFQDYKAAEAGWLWYPEFRPVEFRCRASGALLVVPAFMDRLLALRRDYGQPIIINSGYRSPDHNAAVSATASRTGPHTQGRAVDIRITDKAQAAALAALGLKWGFTFLGIRTHGPVAGWLVHLDDVERPGIKGALLSTYPATEPPADGRADPATEPA